MTGKEAIEQLKEKYHNYIIDYYYSSNISKEKRDTLYLMYDEEFEAIDKQLTKYKRAFEILINHGFKIVRNIDMEAEFGICFKSCVITGQEFVMLYELLEELMKDA